MTSWDQRCLGLEQELFLVDEGGILSNSAEELLAGCWEAARSVGKDPACFAPEVSLSMIEVIVPPARSLAELSREYLECLKLALEAGRGMGLRLYPLATYPLPMKPALRDEPRYRMQARTLGEERYLQAGCCTGVHLHLGVHPGAVDPRVGVSYDAPKEARKELLDLYNLATALDPAIVTLGRSSPFYEGLFDGRSPRTLRYRGHPDFAPDGLLANLQEVGGLLPYATDVEELVEQQFASYHAWLAAMDRAGVQQRLFFETGGGLLKASWNPVRLNPKGTVELRAIDGNYPHTVLALAALVSAAADRVRREGLTVVPREGLKTFEAADDALYVPSFEYLSGDLFRAAVTQGLESSEIVSYLDSVVRFAATGAGHAEESGLEALTTSGSYRTTEAEILKSLPSPVSPLLQEEGLRIVREACNELEEQVASLGQRFWSKESSTR